MVEHTPGPWFIHEELDEMGHMQICAVDPDDDDPWFVAVTTAGAHSEGEDPEVANARLISAAPEMYRALKVWMEWDSTAKSGNDVRAMLDYADAMNLTRIAMFKALGSEQ